MPLRETRIFKVLILVFTLFSCFCSSTALGQQSKSQFTVADEIGINIFGGPEGAAFPEDRVRFSPDGKYFAVYTSRGNVQQNRVEATLSVYRSSDIRHLLKNPGASAPVPFWSTTVWSEEGPVISHWGWLANSSGVAFVQRTPGGRGQIVLAEIGGKSLQALSPEDEDVGGAYFDIRDREHYVYTSSQVAIARENQQKRNLQTSIVGTGRTVWDLVTPQSASSFQNVSHIWAVIDGKRMEVKAEENEFTLSPDGRSIVTREPVQAPASWGELYPPPFDGDPSVLHSGQNVHRYVRIDLESGKMETLLDAPAAEAAGWYAGTLTVPRFSPDGRFVVLPGTFLQSGSPTRPCLAVVELSTKNATCIWLLKGHTKDGRVEPDFRWVGGIRFLNGDSGCLLVTFFPHDDLSNGSTTEYRRTAHGKWSAAQTFHGVLADNLGPNGLRVTVRDGLNDPPQLVATDGQVVRIIWDPNPHLKNMSLGHVSVFTWKDNRNLDWTGGLYLPPEYVPGRPYPLVIQTHGFNMSGFDPAGAFPTAFAAQELASHGIVVLQAGLTCPVETPEEAPCAVTGYAAGARQLVEMGIVDPNAIGLIGFSRTGLYVMKALTTNVLHLKAASATDSYMIDYFQYVLWPGHAGTNLVGAPPFGEGLQKWLQLAPSFNFDKARAPLLDTGLGPQSLLSMWLPYSLMNVLRKPVELMMLNVDNGGGTLPYEHVLTNPGLRVASQGGNVDWFRFWLQGFEDPDPSKADQYVRWRGLKKMQEENDARERPSKN
jgi:dipeptidyl aminopeptidase/acylaminoacyl peptidase